MQRLWNLHSHVKNPVLGRDGGGPSKERKEVSKLGFRVCSQFALTCVGSFGEFGGVISSCLRLRRRTPLLLHRVMCWGQGRRVTVLPECSQNQILVLVLQNQT